MSEPQVQKFKAWLQRAKTAWPHEWSEEPDWHEDFEVIGWSAWKAGREALFDEIEEGRIVAATTSEIAGDPPKAPA